MVWIKLFWGMYRIPMPLMFSIMTGVVFHASFAGEPFLLERSGPEAWQTPYAWPAPRPIPFAPDVADRLERRAWRDEASMRNILAELLWLARNAPPPWRPFFFIRLAGVCIDVDEDHAAYQALRMFQEEMSRLPPTVPLEGGLGSPERRMTLGRLLEARILARNGKREAFERIVGGLTLHTGYESLLLAEAKALVGDKSGVTPLLIRALNNPDGHPDRRWGTTLIPMRALVLAHGLGLDSLVFGWYKNGRTSVSPSRWPQERSSNAIIQKTIEAAQKGPWQWNAFRDGVYGGTCRGFDDTLRVSVTVNKGKVVDIHIASTYESRPMSSFTVIPRRILHHQSLTVDAVTGATVTSCAILMAVEEALRKARR